MGDSIINPGSQTIWVMEKTPEESKSYELRKAIEQDFPAIRSLIHQVKINPIGLHWRNFLIAVDPQGSLIGCGQVKRHQDGSFELASIAVVTEWRRQGIASHIIRQLLDSHRRLLYLTCQAEMETFYKRFDFISIDTLEMPPYFRRISRIVSFLGKSGLIPDTLLVMRRSA